MKKNYFKNNFNLMLFFALFLSFASKAQINVNSTGGQTSTTSYTTLKLAFDSINVGKHSGSITITVVGNTTESATAVLNASGTGGASYASILIKPSGGGLKTISASLAAPLIDLNGSDNVTIDGLYPGNDSLLIVNASTSTTAGTSTIRFINGACNNAIQNCGVFGGSASTTSGTIFFSTDASANGNDNNLISGVLMGEAASAATPRYQIYAAGTTGKENSTNTIRGCWIYNFNGASTGDRAGIYIGAASTDYTIYGNSFFQESSRSISSATFSAIYINNTSGNYLIRKNKIGGTAPDCGGSTLSITTSPLLQAIYLNVATSAKTIVDSNTIANITMSTTNTSIVQSLLHINNGKVDIKYNSFGSQSLATSISIPSSPTSTTFSVIGMGSGSFDTISILNNTIGGVSISGSGGMSLRGVDITGSTATMLINNNTFGSPSVTNSMYQATDNSLIGIIMRGNLAGVTHQIMNNTFSNFSATIGIIRAISSGGSTSSWNISNNTISNFSSQRYTTGTGTSAAIIGIISSGGGADQKVSGNIIHTFKLSGIGVGSMTVSGITVSGPATGNCVLSNNLIHSLTANNPGATVNAIDILSGVYVYYNNMIRLGLDETGAAFTNAIYFNGINESAGTNSLYYNTIYIGGSGTGSGTAFTAALNSAITAATREIRNNIFANLRSGATNGKHYSVVLGSVAAQNVNNNDYYNGATFNARLATTDYSSLTSWQAATAQDSLSVSADPVFKNANGSSSNLNLHIDTAGTGVSYLESSGAVISGYAVDFDNDTRPGPNGSVKGGGTKPDIGADEFDGVPRPNCNNTVAGTVVSTADTICLSGAVTLSLSGSTGLGVGNTYQWQNSSNGVNFSDINNATLSQYNTGTITTTTYYRCIVKCFYGSTTSNSSIKKILVSNPQITGTTPAQRCGPGSITLAATASSGTIKWYANASGGTVLDTGVTYTISSLATTTTFYVEAAIGNCTSASRTPVIATISVVPTITGITPGSNCGTGSVTLSASCSAGTIGWYANATGGTALATGGTYTTPSISTTTTYYVEAIYATCSSPSRTPIVATVIPLPTVTSTTPGTVCGSGKATLQATPSSGYISWYSTATGGTVLDTGNTFITPTIFSGTNYYAEAKNGTCVSSPRTAVAAVVSSIPTINGVISASGCKNDKITLGAAASAGTINWYTTATGGTAIATGPSYITPALTATTVYYVDATNNGCTTSFRTPVTATINITPSITSVTHGVVCGSGSMTLGATGSAGIVNWYTDSIGGTLLTSGNSYTTSNLNTTTYYYVEATSNGCTSSPRTRVVANVKKIPTISTTNGAQSCKPASLTLSASTASGTIRWYSVAFGGAVLATGNTYTTPLLNNTTTYFVDVIDSGCVTTSRVAVDATIYPTMNDSVVVTGTTITAQANGVTYQWVNCNNGYAIITGATNKNYTATQNGSYAVIIKDNFCSDTSKCIVFNKIGISSIIKNDDIKLAPNPAGDFIILQTGASSLGSQYSILDICGRMLYSGVIENKEQRISLIGLASGNYFFRIGGESPLIIKLIKY